MARSLTKFVYIMLTFGSLNLWAAIYRFPVYPEPRELKRPAPGLETKPKTLRILNISLGNYMGAVAIEFEPQDKGYLRTKTYSIDFLQDAMRTVINDTSCDAVLRNQRSGQMFIDTMLLGTPQRRIGIQALKEMEARQYLTPNQVEDQMQSAEGTSPDGFVFIESLSWVGADEAIRIFQGEIPWERIAEVEAPYGLSVEEIQKRALAGDKNVQLRVRRATLRISLGVTFHHFGISHTRLPFEEELWKSGRNKFTPKGARFKFEFGRAAQIPGLAHEAVELAGFGAMVAAHHVLLAGDQPEALRPDLNRVYFHSLKPSHTRMYEDGLGASPLPGLNEPQDTVLEMTLDELMNRTSAKAGMDMTLLRSVRQVMERAFYTFDWKIGAKDMTPSSPIIIKPRREFFLKNARIAANNSNDPGYFNKIVDRLSLNLDQPIISPASVRGDSHINYLPQDWQSQAELAISGFNPWLAETDPLYVKKLLFSLSKEFNLRNERLLIATNDTDVVAQAMKLGMKCYEYVGKDGKVRWALYFTWKDLQELKRADPELAEQMNLEARMETSMSRIWFSLVNLDGLL